MLAVVLAVVFGVVTRVGPAQGYSGGADRDAVGDAGRCEARTGRAASDTGLDRGGRAGDSRRGRAVINLVHAGDDRRQGGRGDVGRGVGRGVRQGGVTRVGPAQGDPGGADRDAVGDADVAKLALDALQVMPVSTGVVAQVTVAVVVPS